MKYESMVLNRILFEPPQVMRGRLESCLTVFPPHILLCILSSQWVCLTHGPALDLDVDTCLIRHLCICSLSSRPCKVRDVRWRCVQRGNQKLLLELNYHRRPILSQWVILPGELIIFESRRWKFSNLFWTGESDLWAIIAGKRQLS